MAAPSCGCSGGQGSLPCISLCTGACPRPPFLLSWGIKVAARLQRPTNHLSFQPPTPLQHGRGFPSAGAASVSQESYIQWTMQRSGMRRRRLGFHSVLGKQEAWEGAPHPLPSPGLRGVAVASPEPFKEACYTPGPRPAATRGYTWKSAAAGSASASVAAGPDQE